MNCHYCPQPATQRHHIIRQGQLSQCKRQAELKQDERNLLSVCWSCHQRLHSGGPNAIRESEADLPEGFWSFVAENSLFGKLPRHLRTDQNWFRTGRAA